MHGRSLGSRAHNAGAPSKHVFVLCKTWNADGGAKMAGLQPAGRHFSLEIIRRRRHPKPNLVTAYRTHNWIKPLKATQEEILPARSGTTSVQAGGRKCFVGPAMRGSVCTQQSRKVLSDFGFGCHCVSSQKNKMLGQNLNFSIDLGSSIGTFRFSTSPFFHRFGK